MLNFFHIDHVSINKKEQYDVSISIIKYEINCIIYLVFNSLKLLKTTLFLNKHYHYSLQKMLGSTRHTTHVYVPLSPSKMSHRKIKNCPITNCPISI